MDGGGGHLFEILTMQTSINSISFALSYIDLSYVPMMNKNAKLVLIDHITIHMLLQVMLCHLYPSFPLVDCTIKYGPRSTQHRYRTRPSIVAR